MADWYLIYGENVDLSRSRLNELIGASQAGETVRLDGQKVALSEIKQALEAKSLFGGERLVVIERLLSSISSRRQAEIVQYLQETKPDSPLILWESRQLKETTLSSLRKNFKIEVFKIPATIFKFLDSLAPGKSRLMLYWLHQIRQKEPEMIFSLLAGRVRQLLEIKESDIESFKGLPDWRREKLERQSKLFTFEQLRTLYRQLLEIDHQQKTSQAPLSLFFSLDLVVSNL